MKYLKLFFLYALGCLTVVLATTSCGDDDDGLQFGQSGGGSTAGTPSKEITERMETPQVLTNGSTVLLSHFTKEKGKDVLCSIHAGWPSALTATPALAPCRALTNLSPTTLTCPPN